MICINCNLKKKEKKNSTHHFWLASQLKSFFHALQFAETVDANSSEWHHYWLRVIMRRPAEIPHDCVRPPAMVTNCLWHDLTCHVFIRIPVRDFRGTKTAGRWSVDRIVERIENKFTASHALISRQGREISLRSYCSRTTHALCDYSKATGIRCK